MAAVFAPDGAIPSNGSQVGGNGLALFATRIANVPLEEIARVLGKERTQACRIRSGEKEATLQDLVRLLPLCGLKLVDKDKVCVDRKAYDSMSYIASKALANQATAQTLIWDEGQE